MTTESLLEIASFSPEAINFPNPWVGHLPFAAWVIRDIAPRIFVELGTHTGNSYFAFCQSVAEAGLPTRCYAVDTWKGDAHAGEYADEVFTKVHTFNSSHFSNFSALLRTTFDEAVNSFDEQSIDLLHIDGLHTYEAVRHDFETWLPKLSPGAIVIFHDTNIYERGFGVWRFWEELQKRYPNTLSFFHSCGLGILQIPPHQDTEIREWLKPEYALRKEFVAFFRALGMHQLERYEHTQKILQLEQTVADRDGMIVERDRMIAERVNDLTARDQTIASLQIDLAQRKETITFLRNDVINREEQIAALLTSTSWRLTRPIRFLRRLPGRMASLLRLGCNLCGLFYGQVRLYGPLGFLKRIPYYLKNARKAFSLASSRPLAADGGLFNAPTPQLHDIRLHPDLLTGEKRIAASISVVIPTLNAGAEFPLLLRKLASQQGMDNVEIVIVDSGSQDETVNIAQAAGCTVVEIQPADFSHSHARNVGADAATGDYLLFMVQDAFPIGNYWAYGMLSFLLEHGDRKLAAVSCAEYSRSDSDMMYDAMINTHYRFLGCLDHDRLGEFKGADHMALRANGQLSDVACLIGRDLFQQYRYQGNYAEDLDLGIRLIKDGYRVAMLASVKVIHSHNRSAFYYFKRSFVDVVFLTGLFPDFSIPQCDSQRGLISAIVTVAAHLSPWLTSFENTGAAGSLHQELDQLIARWRKEFGKSATNGQSFFTGDAPLDTYLHSLADRFLPEKGEDNACRSETSRFLEMFLSRLAHFNAFAREVYGEQDDHLHHQLREVVLKTFCAAAGASLGFMFVQSRQFEPHDRQVAETIFNELKAGI